MIWDQLLGHENQTQMFRRAVRRGRIAHAYLFLGPRGIGKKLFAKLLAQCLFCQRVPREELDACGECDSCRQVATGNHPDLLSIGKLDGKREILIGQLLGEEERRGREGLCREIAMTPLSAPRRIAIIDDADAFSDASGNALLKTLEEPPPGAILILISPDEDRVLPTLRSRCQPVQFAKLSSDQVRSLVASGEDSAELDQVLDLSDGSVELARTLLEPGLRRLWQVVEEQFRGREIDPREASHAITSALESLGTDTATQRVNMRWALDFAIETLRRRLVATDDPDQLDRLGSLLDRCFEAEAHLHQMMPVPLCLEALLAELSRRSRLPALV